MDAGARGAHELHDGGGRDGLGGRGNPLHAEPGRALPGVPHAPPRANTACISDASVALYSKPGSRSRAERSIRPGQTTRLAASMVRSARNPAGALPSATIFPAEMNTSCFASTRFLGSITRPFLMWTVITCKAFRPCA